MTLQTFFSLHCGGSGRIAALYLEELFFSPLPQAAKNGVAGVTSPRMTRTKILIVIWRGLSRTVEERCSDVTKSWKNQTFQRSSIS